MSNSEFAFLETLENIVRQRLVDRPAGSYTAKLADAGTRRMAQKVGEEGVELALAAASGEREDIVAEAADLIYHLLVVLADGDVRLLVFVEFRLAQMPQIA